MDPAQAVFVESIINKVLFLCQEKITFFDHQFQQDVGMSHSQFKYFTDKYSQSIQGLHYWLHTS